MRPDFETAWAANLSRVTAFALNLADGHKANAEDIVQEAVLRARAGYPKFRGHSTVSTWLYRICTNVHLDIRKKNLKREGDTDLESARNVEDVRTSGTRIEGSLIAQEALRLVSTTLEPFYLQVLVLYHAEDMNYNEIAAALRVPVGTVKSRLHRARILSRKILTDAGYDARVA